MSSTEIPRLVTISCRLPIKPGLSEPKCFNRRGEPNQEDRRCWAEQVDVHPLLAREVYDSVVDWLVCFGRLPRRVLVVASQALGDGVFTSMHESISPTSLKASGASVP